MMDEHEESITTEKSGGNRFANAVVAVLLLAGILASAAVVAEYYRLGQPVPADVLEEILGFMLSELGILAGRQIVGSDVLKWLRRITQAGAADDTEDQDIFGGSV